MSAFTGGGTVLGVLQDCETAEQGRLFCAGDGSVILRGRLSASTRTTESVVQATYSRASIPYCLPVRLVRNNEQVRNAITVTRSGGPSTYVEDSTSRNTKGTRPLAVTLQVTTDLAASGAASWLLARLKDPLTRVVVLEVDMLSDPTGTYLSHAIGDEIGTRVTLTHTTNKAETVTVTGLLDGVHNVIGRDSWKLQYWLDRIEVASAVPTW
jgi:hypothetical protein